jgi:hypothetical protein
VVRLLPRMTAAEPQQINQAILQQAIGLSSSFLVSDSTTDPENGISAWLEGFDRLIKIVEALHKQDKLELETVNAASKACSECWSVASSWRGLEASKDGVRSIAGKLKLLLDGNGKTYRGERVYAP